MAPIIPNKKGTAAAVPLLAFFGIKKATGSVKKEAKKEAKKGLVAAQISLRRPRRQCVLVEAGPEWQKIDIAPGSWIKIKQLENEDGLNEEQFEK